MIRLLTRFENHSSAKLRSVAGIRCFDNDARMNEKADKTSRRMYELEVRQAELEMQNWHLKEWQRRLEQSHARYSDLEKRHENELALLSRIGAVAVDSPNALEATAAILVPAIADVVTIDLLEGGGVAPVGKMKHVYTRPGWKTVRTKVIESNEPMLLQELPDVLREVAYDEADAHVIRAAGIRSMIILPLTVRGRAFGALSLATAESERRYTPASFQFAENVAARIATTIDNGRLLADIKRAVAARDALLAVVSHDLRNSINVIQLKAYLMSQRSEPQVREDGGFIGRRAGDMERLIQDLLDISSIDAGQLRLERGRHSAVGIVRKAFEALEFQAAQKALKLRIEVPAEEKLDVNCDPDRIQQVLSNLIGNAVKCVPRTGSIQVRVVPQANDVCFAVADTGPGISQSDLPHIFDRFWSTSRNGKNGIGLGLSIAKGLVETHGGRIWVESHVGAGSTFFFTLPRVSMAQES